VPEDLYLSNIRLQILPPDTPARLRPVGENIITSIKTQYRKQLLRHVMAGTDDTKTSLEVAKHVSLLYVAYWLDLAWTSVKVSVIKKSFAECGLCPSQQQTKEKVANDEGHEDSGMSAYQELLGGVEWTDYVAMDNSDVFTHSFSDSGRSAMVLDAESQSINYVSPDEPCPDAVISPVQALGYSKAIVDLAAHLGHSQLLSAAMNVKSVLEDLQVHVSQTGKVGLGSTLVHSVQSNLS
jgi:hypothetical protein